MVNLLITISLVSTAMKEADLVTDVLILQQIEDLYVVKSLVYKIIQITAGFLNKMQAKKNKIQSNDVLCLSNSLSVVVALQCS